jgi:electron transport complex protein RnfG
MSHIIRLSIILAIVTFIAAWTLAEIYRITKPRIEFQKMAKTEAALKYVLPDVKIIRPMTQKVPIKDGKGQTLYEKDEIVYYRALSAEDSNLVVGYAFMAFGSGYSSIIETMVGIDTTGKIQRIKIISQKETPGLGALAEESGPFDGRKWSTQQFIDKNTDQLKVDKDGGPVVSITGATITSRAITNSIKSKMQVLLTDLAIMPSKNSQEN